MADMDQLVAEDQPQFLRRVGSLGQYHTGGPAPDADGQGRGGGAGADQRQGGVKIVCLHGRAHLRGDRLAVGGGNGNLAAEEIGAGGGQMGGADLW